MSDIGKLHDILRELHYSLGRIWKKTEFLQEVLGDTPTTSAIRFEADFSMEKLVELSNWFSTDLTEQKRQAEETVFGALRDIVRKDK